VSRNVYRIGGASGLALGLGACTSILGDFSAGQAGDAGEAGVEGGGVVDSTVSGGDALAEAGDGSAAALTDSQRPDATANDASVRDAVAPPDASPPGDSSPPPAVYDAGAQTGLFPSCGGGGGFGWIRINVGGGNVAMAATATLNPPLGTPPVTIGILSQ
jgi:hypothetical protein